MLHSSVITTIKDLVDPRELLLFLGFTINYENNKELRGPCAIHGGDNRTAFCFMKDTKRFYCFSHGCERDDDGLVRNDVIDLVMKKRGCSFKEAVDTLAKIAGVDIESIEDSEIEAERRKIEKSRKEVLRKIAGKDDVLPEIDRTILEVYKSKGCPYFSAKGISDDIIRIFELGTMVDRHGIERASIPIFDAAGRLVSISGRRTDGDREPRYLLTSDFNKKKVLYGLDKVIKLPYAERRTVIIVEGFKALWHVYSAGFKNVVALMGRVISKEQINLLSSNNVDYALLLLDGDEPGRKGAETSANMMRGMIECVKIDLPKDISPDDVSLEEIRDLLTMFI